MSIDIRIPVTTNTATAEALRGGADPSSSESLVDDLAGALDGVIPARVLEELFSSAANTSLTPEMVLTMARSKLRDLDEQLQGILTAIQDTTKHTELLNNKIENLQSIRRDLTEAGEAPGDVYELTEEEKAGLEALGLDLGDETSISALDAQIDKLRTDVKEINSGTEMLMMQAQTVGGQRANTLQIATSFIKKMDDSLMSIARNI